MRTLLLEAVDYRDDGRRWRWHLTTQRGGRVAYQDVELDHDAAEYQGYLDLDSFVRRQGDPEDRLASEKRDGIGSHRYAPITPQV